MISRINSVLVTLCFLGILVIECNAGNKWQKTEDKSITCYVCTSAEDPRCGDPFDPYTIGTVNCSMRQPLEHIEEQNAVLCRKTTQKVNGIERVIRDCGYITDEKDDKECMRRTGTHDVFVYYCSCTKNLCNSSPNIRPVSNLVIATVMFLSATLLIV